VLSPVEAEFDVVTVAVSVSAEVRRPAVSLLTRLVFWSLRSWITATILRARSAARFA
jgi:hypothetical protein